MNLPNRASDAGPDSRQPPTVSDLLDEAGDYIREAESACRDLVRLGLIDFALTALIEARCIVRAQLGSPVNPSRGLAGELGTGVAQSTVQSLVLPTDDDSGAQGQPATARESDTERDRR